MDSLHVLIFNEVKSIPGEKGNPVRDRKKKKSKNNKKFVAMKT
jgi:hypothetical protein